jgi:hypothetical protein
MGFLIAPQAFCEQENLKTKGGQCDKQNIHSP